MTGEIPLDISLKNPTYKKGLISTREGGIVRGKDFYLQAQYITYDQKENGQILKASGDLLLDHRGKLYRADSITIDFAHQTMEATNGITKWGDWFIVAEKITLSFEGNGTFYNATLTTSNNEKDDWSFWSKEVQIQRGESIHAQPVVFHFDKLPILYLPSLSKTLKKDESDLHLHYRVRYKGSQAIFGISTLFYQSPLWSHKAVVDYSTKYGIGCGVHSNFTSDDSVTHFNCLNYVAQSKQGLLETTLPTTRYRALGGFSSFHDTSGVKIRGMYDKLSDKGMQTNFSDHKTKYIKAGLTQVNLTKEESDYLARLNTTVRVNNFQTIKQKLPLLSLNQHTFELGNSGCLLDQQFSVGYLRYVYAHNTPHATNFTSSRAELDQRIYRPFNLSVVQCTPWMGWRGVQYNSSPRNGSIVQAIGEGGVRLNTHMTGSTSSTVQLLEPYVDVTMRSPSLHKANKVYIFDIQDSFQQVCFAKPGFQHTTFFLPNERGFQQSLYSELYGLFFFNTPHLQSNKPRIRWNETWNMTEKTAWKTALEYDSRRHRWTYGSILMRYTLSETVATGIEFRAQDKWYFRKMDLYNYDIESFRSPKKLLSTEMSDPRNSWIFSIEWNPTPRLEMEFKTVQGVNKKNSKDYHVQEVGAAFLVRGAFRIHFSVTRKTGKAYSWHLSASLGQNKGSSALLFNKMGRGNYDIW